MSGGETHPESAYIPVWVTPYKTLITILIKIIPAIIHTAGNNQ